MSVNQMNKGEKKKNMVLHAYEKGLLERPIGRPFLYTIPRDLEQAAVVLFAHGRWDRVTGCICSQSAKRPAPGG